MGDAGAVFVGEDGRTAACVVDGIGTTDEVHDLMDVAAEAAVRVAPRRGVLAGLAMAAEIVADPGFDDSTPTGVAVLALAERGGDTLVSWVGGLPGVRMEPARGPPPAIHPGPDHGPATA